MLGENPPDDYKPIIIQAPKISKYLMLGSDGFREIERYLKKLHLEWDVFWCCYCLIVIYRVAGIKDDSIFSRKTNALPTKRASFELVKTLIKLLGEPDIVLLAKDQLRYLDEKFSNKPRMLFFDGLDTGFGSKEEDLNRRKEAISGLFSLWYELQELDNIRWKIFLRQDIWDSISFQNKSHLYGKSLILRWEKNDFYKTILKQALASPFKTYAEKRLGFDLIEEIELWPEERLNNVMFQLVAERMRGGRTAFTTNWIWNRLSDGNGDHSPGYLFQLFREATQWEKDEQKKNPYERSIIRPRALIRVMHRVSNEALTALRDEYPELHNFIDWLRNRRSPLKVKEIRNTFKEDFAPKLAQDVGLLSIYEESEGDILRFAVPDLYLGGLNMTRKGQA